MQIYTEMNTHISINALIIYMKKFSIVIGYEECSF